MDGEWIIGGRGYKFVSVRIYIMSWSVTCLATRYVYGINSSCLCLAVEGVRREFCLDMRVLVDCVIYHLLPAAHVAHGCGME